MKNTIIIILSIAVIALGGYFVYDKVIAKDNECAEKENFDNKDNNSNNETISRDKDEYVGLALSRYAMLEWYLSDDKLSSDPDYIVRRIDLPKLLFDAENAKKINEKIYNDYIYDIENLNVKTEKPYYFDITYNYSIKDSILSLMVERSAGSSRSGGGVSRKAYYYDMKNDKELSVDEVSKMFDITLDKVKNNNLNVDKKNSKNATGISSIMLDQIDCEVYYTTSSGAIESAHVKCKKD